MLEVIIGLGALILEVLCIMLLFVTINKFRKDLRVGDSYSNIMYVSPIGNAASILGAILCLLVYNGMLWSVTEDYRNPCLESKQELVFHPSEPMYQLVGKVMVYIGDSQPYSAHEQVCIKRK